MFPITENKQIKKKNSQKRKKIQKMTYVLGSSIFNMHV